MNTRQLRTLLAVREHGSVHAAAAALFLSPSAVSQQLRSLATACGFSVVERDGRGIRLTARGLEMAALGDELIRRWDSTVDSLRRTAAEPVERPARAVRLGALPSAYRTWLFPVVHRLRTRGRLAFELFETAPHEAYEEVEAGRLDLAVVVRPPGPRATSLTSHPLYRDPFVLVVPRALGGTAPSLRGLADAGWVLPGRETHCHEVIVRHCARLGFRPRAAARSNDWQAMQEMALLLGAVAVVPASCLAPRDGLAAVELSPAERFEWRIELTTRASATAMPWFTAFDREVSRLSFEDRLSARSAA
ncbi:LysR family transcriptional regulator [Actinomadura parmotrematis]|uniref:LysR family transcriptional regulator n=1 Tax=Actinomadura parmotrematis TaxID=2864039 RepID=A0ABS7G2Q4_9ACTN|nr:LysR family transcriptional regulator [Actinomadura parmotrematis]MBW8486811.1 LysR family transcriptional regulator [Actinomadura parmotrematis]